MHHSCSCPSTRLFVTPFRAVTTAKGVSFSSAGCSPPPLPHLPLPRLPTDHPRKAGRQYSLSPHLPPATRSQGCRHQNVQLSGTAHLCLSFPGPEGGRKGQTWRRAGLTQEGLHAVDPLLKKQTLPAVHAYRKRAKPKCTAP